MRNGDENADDIAGRFTGTYTGADARSCKYGTTCEITDKKGKGLPESGKGEALEIPHSPEKEPVSCLTDWHYSSQQFCKECATGPADQHRVIFSRKDNTDIHPALRRRANRMK